MKKVQESLLAYRKTKKLLENPRADASTSDDTVDKQTSSAEENSDNINVTPTSKQSHFQPLNFLDVCAIDCLNIYPMRKWREFCMHHPLQCWVTTGCVWMTGQLLFAAHDFGCVYFILSLFVLMFLNLGVRKEGEASAYSVFNPNCERLLGQMTEEHFERDILRRPRDDEE